MKILILGAAGMIGRKLAQALQAENQLSTSSDTLILHDVVMPVPVQGQMDCTTLSGDLSDPAQTEALAALRPDIIFHLASIVSGKAERDFDLGWQVNMKGGWHFIEALRRHHDDSQSAYRPKVIFASSIAIFGPPFPEAIDDEFLAAPQTSYGTQKAMMELLIADYARKGFIDGLSIRLPTICVRPGKPNAAASSFFSGIIREPLNGRQAILPVPISVRHWHASPRSAVGFMIQAALLDEAKLAGRRALNMPGVSCTVEEQIEALRAAAGEAAVSLIKPRPDDAIMSIVKSWPQNFNPLRAKALGFAAEADFSEIIQIYQQDDL